MLVKSLQPKKLKYLGFVQSHHNKTVEMIHIIISNSILFNLGAKEVFFFFLPKYLSCMVIYKNKLHFWRKDRRTDSIDCERWYWLTHACAQHKSRKHWISLQLNKAISVTFVKACCKLKTRPENEYFTDVCPLSKLFGVFLKHSLCS